jgi:predicted flap endonuclease-1-like 5' DNA nuclease
MNYLLSQIFLCLLAAFILGAIIGWLWKNQNDKTELTKLKKRLANCKKDLDGHKSLNEKMNAKPKVKQEKSILDTPEKTKDPVIKTIAEDGGTPAFLNAPRGGKADDLKRIKGIGKVLEGILFEQGVFHFEQIASWSDENAKWMDTFMKFPGRIEREQWRKQAKQLHQGLETDFSKKVDKNKIYD